MIRASARWWGIVGIVVIAACSADPDPTPTPVPSPSSTASSRPTSLPVPTAEPLQTDDGGVYLALGDSVTFGVGVPQPQRNGYPARVVDRLAGAGSTIGEARVLAVPGETATGFLENRIDDVEAAIDELGPRVELVTIGLGANELLRIRRHPACVEDRASPECQGIAAAAAEEAAAALDEVVARLQVALDAADAEPTVLLLAYYNPDVEPIAVATIVGADGVVACDPADPAPGLNDRIACVAERREVGLVNLYAAFLGREDELTGIGRGDVHPNAEGYRVIAEAILDALPTPTGEASSSAQNRTGVRIG